MMEQHGGVATGSHERNQLVRVRHGSDSGVGVSHNTFCLKHFSS